MVRKAKTKGTLLSHAHKSLLLAMGHPPLAASLWAVGFARSLMKHSECTARVRVCVCVCVCVQPGATALKIPAAKWPQLPPSPCGTGPDVPESLWSDRRAMVCSVTVWLCARKIQFLESRELKGRGLSHGALGRGDAFRDGSVGGISC